MDLSARLRLAPPSQTTNPVAGILFKLLAVFLFATMDLLVKWLTQSYPILQVVLFRSVFGLLPILVLILLSGRGGWRKLATRRPGAHALRALVGVAFIFIAFTVFKHLPMADAYTLLFAGPLFVVALSVPMLGEPVGWRRWSAVGVGFLGIVVAFGPGAGLQSPYALLALFGALVYALQLTLVRLYSRTETNESLVFYMSLSAAVVAGIGVIPEWVMPAAGDWLLLILCGLVGGTAQICVTHSLRLAPSAILAPFDYTALVWGTLFGFLVFGDVPGVWLGLGAAIVIASGLYILHRERVHGRAPAPPGRLG